MSKKSPHKDEGPYFDEIFIDEQPIFASELPGDDIIRSHVQETFACLDIMLVIYFHPAPLHRSPLKTYKGLTPFYQINPSNGLLTLFIFIHIF